MSPRLSLEPLAQIMLARPGRISLECPEQLVAELLIERARLKIERIEACVGAATRSRQVLGRFHKSLAKSLTAHTVVHPKLGNVQPAPTRVTKDAADDGAICI